MKRTDKSTILENKKGIFCRGRVHLVIGPLIEWNLHLIQGQSSTWPTISEVEKQKFRHKSTPLIAEIFHKNCTFYQGKTIR